jgi:hypothetical protein
VVSTMSIEQTLLAELQDSKRWLDIEKDYSTFRRDLVKRIELIDWALENMKIPDTKICDLLEEKMNEVVLEINRTSSIFESNKLHSELRIMDWILDQVRCNEINSHYYYL